MSYEPEKDIQEILFTESEIAARVKELARTLGTVYGDRSPEDPLILVGVLKGALPFMADLIRALKFPLIFDVMMLSSYGATTRSTGTVLVLKDLKLPIEGRDVVVVEDIIDSGVTLNFLRQYLAERHPRSVKTCVFLDKPERREVAEEADFYGFKIPNHFVVGYGLDYAEKYRNLPFIGVLKKELYQT